MTAEEVARAVATGPTVWNFMDAAARDRLAHEIARWVRLAVLDEREACAGLAETMWLPGYDHTELSAADRTRLNIAAAIRSRPAP